MTGKGNHITEPASTAGGIVVAGPGRSAVSARVAPIAGIALS